MIRRKNNQFEYIQPRQDQSPYRFQRKNINLSPGISTGFSPIRCRTPTRNVSPLRINNYNINNNQRPTSPIKFVNTKNNAFFKNQNQQNNIHLKYAMGNDYHKRDILYNVNQNQYHTLNNDNGKYKINYQQINYQKAHNATQKVKLFSNLVSKLNCQKKKQVQPFKKNNFTKQNKENKYLKQINFNTENVINIQKSKQKPKQKQPIKFVKRKSQPDQQQLKKLECHIIPVQSLLYQESKNSDHYFQKHNYFQHPTSYQANNKLSKIQDKESSKKSKQNQQSKHNNNSNSVKSIKSKILKPVLQQELAKKVQSNVYTKYTNLKQPQMNNQQSFDDYQDVRIYLNKAKQSKTIFIKESFKNNNVEDSLMNMNPYL